MSKYIVTNSSYFQPFSYDELAKPVQQMTEAHLASSDAYDQLSMETEALRRYISDNEDDMQAKALYDNYINKLNTLQDNLWNRGYSLGTRRDLSAARAAYASDITRLKSAVQARQERSKEYWDARHKNPELVTGFDPAMSGLDNYLNDSEYGRNWYSYNGSQFANEVAAEAKARGNELVNAYATRDPQLAGYLMYHLKNGFTNAQVNGAGALAQRILKGEATLDDPNNDAVENLLAGTLITRLQSTGAMPGKNLSAEEFGRLFNYGMLGLSQSVGTEDIKPINDKVWDESMARGRIAYNHALSQKAAAAQGEGVHRELIDRSVVSPEATKTNKRLSKIYDDETYKDGKTVLVNLPGGGGRELHSAEEAMELFQTERARKFFEATGGMDVRAKASDWWHTKDSKQTGEYNGAPIMARRANPLEVMFNKNINPGDAIVKQKVNGKWVKHSGLTDMWNQAANDYSNWESKLAAANPGLNLSSIGLTPEEAQQLRKEANLPSTIPDYDVRAAYEAKTYVGDQYGIPVASGPEDDDLKKRIANNINGLYANAHSNKEWRESENGFYAVDSGNATSAKQSSAAGKNKSLANVFTVSKDGTIDPSSIYNVYVMPQDIKDGKVKVRLETSKGTFVTDISTLGDSLNGAMNSRVVRALELLMSPLNNKIDVLDTAKDTDGQIRDAAIQLFGRDIGIRNWSDFARVVLDRYESPAIPVDGRWGVAPADVVARNPQLQRMLLNGIDDYIKDVIAFGIDPITLHPRQHKGYTSSKAEGLYGEE